MTWRQWEAKDPAETLDRIRAERRREERWQAKEAARLLAEAEREQQREAKRAQRKAERESKPPAQCANPFGAICRYMARAEKHRRLVYLIKREGKG